MDKRKLNGGARPNPGPKPLPAGEKKLPVTFMVKAKAVADFKKKVAPIAQQLNSL